MPDTPLDAAALTALADGKGCVGHAVAAKSPDACGECIGCRTRAGLLAGAAALAREEGLQRAFDDLTALQAETSDDYMEAQAEVARLTAELRGYQHEEKLIRADLQRFVTDCSTPAFQLVRNALDQLAEARRAHKWALARAEADSLSAAAANVSWVRSKARVTALETALREVGFRASDSAIRLCWCRRSRAESAPHEPGCEQARQVLAGKEGT